MPDGIYIRFRRDGSVSNLRRLLARTKTMEELITELLFADDCALLAHTEEALRHIVNRFSNADKNFGEAERHEAAKEKHRRQKERAATQSSSAQLFARAK